MWAQLGALSHVGLDEFTHDWGWFARHVSWYDQRLVGTNWLGREWTVFRVVQYVGHVGGSALCVWLLWRYGRARWMRARALAVAVPSVSIRSHAALWVPTALGFGAAGAWVRLHGAGSATDILRLAAGAFVGLLAGSLAVPRLLGAPGRRGES